MRDIEEILLFRQDLSPFLVHMTRNRSGTPAKDALISILTSKQIQSSGALISPARFGTDIRKLDEKDQKRFFSAVCLTETPINEIHCLLEIEDRQVDLEPYGVVFVKDKLAASCPISPILYLNNNGNDKGVVVSELCRLITTASHAAEEILPLISFFGPFLQPCGAVTQQVGTLDFRWEREWRLPHVHCPLKFDKEDVFIGLCPHEEIDEFESRFAKLQFIDPRRNMKWYATKLIEARQRLDLKSSVI